MKMLALSLLLPAIVGPVTFIVMQLLKKASAWVDIQSPAVKRVAVALIAFALTFLAKVTGVEISCNTDTNCLAVLDDETVKAVVGTALAFGLHSLKNAAKKPE